MAEPTTCSFVCLRGFFGRPFLSRFAACLTVGLMAAPENLLAQRPVEGRRMTHREQTLAPYDPFSAEELFKKIPIPPSPALAVPQAIESFRLQPGFRIECVASEPMIADPVMIEFDPDGRLWVVEMRGYMNDLEGSDEGEPSGQIVVLEDETGDGVMDRSTVFLDGLVMPRTVSFVEGGVLVAEPPHLWYCRDTDGDLRCDEKTKVGRYGVPGNPQHVENGLMPALDNWMYSAEAAERHKFASGRLITERTANRGQWGMTQDDHGRLFYNHQDKSLACDLFPGQYALRNPHVAVAAAEFYVGEQSNECFPIRVNPGVTLGGNELRPDGTLRTFTIAAGPSIYRGDNFPARFRGHAVIPEAGGNLVRLDRIGGDGVRITASNAFDREEFLASTDERFRPVSSRTGPDGAVYIVDMYKGIIEHAVFMMPYLRNQILSRGLDKPIHMGRIWRISAEGGPAGERPRLASASNHDLVGHLEHANGWWRDTAQRLLVERRAVDVAPFLRSVVGSSPSVLARIHALWTLEGLGRLDMGVIDLALDADDEHLRATGIRLAERFLAEPARGAILERLQAIAREDSRPVVQLQVLLTLGEFPAGAGLDTMGDILLAHPDRVFHAAGISGLAGRELELLERLAAASEWTREHEERVRTLATLSTAVVNEGVPARIERLLTLGGLVPWQEQAIVAGVLESRLARKRWPEPVMLSAKPRLLVTCEALQDASAAQSPARLLCRIVTWPGDTTTRERRPIIEPLTADQERLRRLGAGIYAATCFACHKDHGQGVAGQAPPLADSEWVNGPLEHLVRIVSHGVEGPIVVRGETWNLKMPGLGHSPLMTDERMAAVLTYVRREWGNYGSPVAAADVAAIRGSLGGRTMPWTVEELLDPAKVRRAEAQSDPLAVYLPLLQQGDAERGRALFHSNLAIRCNACHKVGSSGGGFVGPDLTEVGGRRAPEALLESLIEPSATIVPGYETFVVTTADGVVVAGTLVSEKDGALEIALPAGGSTRIAAADVDDRVQSSVSSMPPMAAAFSPEQIADLVAYLASLRPASGGSAGTLDPESRP